MLALRLSDHELSRRWLGQFDSGQDQALAAQLLNGLKLVSTREFEKGIQQMLIGLQSKLGERIAVYPVAPPTDGIVGYDPFEGAIGFENATSSREIGRRRKFGSEDRVGHLLAKLQEEFRKLNGTSNVECSATLKHLHTQGIRHIVFVDDICGSGKRVTDFWKSVPRRIKSLLSLKKLELWIVVYAATAPGISELKRKVPNFPLDHLISVLSTGEIEHFSQDVADLCKRYGDKIGMKQAAMGFRGTAAAVVFEHGCPNNVPAVLWSKRKTWDALFPHRSVPLALRECFDSDGESRVSEMLWRSGQRSLALSILEALDRKVPLDVDSRMLLTLLGLRMKGVDEHVLHEKVLIDTSEAKRILEKASSSGFYDFGGALVTPLGRELVERFRYRFYSARQERTVGKSPSTYYPSQCEGIFP